MTFKSIDLEQLFKSFDGYELVDGGGAMVGHFLFEMWLKTLLTL